MARKKKIPIFVSFINIEMKVYWLEKEKFIVRTKAQRHINHWREYFKIDKIYTRSIHLFFDFVPKYSKI